MKTEFIEELLENLQGKVDDLLEEVETTKNYNPTKSGDSIEDQILEIKENICLIRELYEKETI
jgi:hypothetical protein